MVLEVDETAHYAFLFTRYRQSDKARNGFEKLFFDELGKAERSVSCEYRKSETIPRPFLIWSETGLGLSIPKLEGRLTLAIGNDLRRLRSGQVWPIPFPWPASVTSKFGNHENHIDVLPSDRHLLVFDNETGRLVATADPARGSSVFVDARKVTLVANSRFNISGELSYEIGSGGFASYAVLGSNPVAVQIGSYELKVQSKPKPRLWIEAGSVTKGTKGHLLVDDARIGIEFGGIDESDFDLAFSWGRTETVKPITKTSSSEFACFDLSNLDVAKKELLPLSIELRLRGSNRALVRYKAWLWPGLRQLKDGYIFDSDTIPENLSLDHSRHITCDSSDRLCLDMTSAFEKAILAFSVGNGRVIFDITRPGISLSAIDAEGRSQPLKIGDTIVLRDEEKGGSLIIRCPDNWAALDVRGRKEPHAFKQTSTRVLSFADLLCPSHSDEIILQRSEPASLPIALARVVPAISPTKFSAGRWRDALKIKIGMQTEIDAIRLTLQNENGDSTEFENALSFRPVESRPPDWLSANWDPDDARLVVVQADLDRLPAGLSVATISVRPTGSDTFRPLRNTRGDCFAVALESSVPAYDAADALGDRFMVANAWMNQCYAKESWDQLGSQIQSKWKALGTELIEKAGGLPLLLLAAHQPLPIGTSKSWVPLAHPLQIFPSLYESPARCFSTLTTYSDDGAEHLSFLAETVGKSIQEIHRTICLWPFFLPSFENFRQAQESFKETRYNNVILQGFDFEKFKQSFMAMDNDPGARWYWRPGDELLGPAHYGAAFGRLIDRLYEAGLEDEGGNDARIRAATTLARYSEKLKPSVLPLPRGLVEDPHAILEWVPYFFSGFARACRTGSAEGYLQEIAREMDRPYRSVIGDASFLVRLAPELFAYYLFLWELVERELQ